MILDGMRDIIDRERDKPRLDAKVYAEHYNRGWKSGRGNAPLDDFAYAARRGLSIWSWEVDAWTDGYLDGAHGTRPKWHLRDRTNHNNSPGGCGVA